VGDLQRGAQAFVFLLVKGEIDVFEGGVLAGLFTGDGVRSSSRILG